MDNNIQRVLEVLSGTQESGKLGEVLSALSKDMSKADINTQTSKKAQRIQRTIDTLNTFKNFTDISESKKYDYIIKVLMIAKLLQEIRDMKE